MLGRFLNADTSYFGPAKYYPNSDPTQFFEITNRVSDLAVQLDKDFRTRIEQQMLTHL